MFWGERIVNEAKERFAGAIAAQKPLIVRDEKTASGRVHIGSMRGVAIHGVVSDVLTEMGIENRYLYEINDFDPMDGLPSDLDPSVYSEHMGKPLKNVPSPDGRAPNFAEFYAEEFTGVIVRNGFSPTFYRASELYESGQMNDVIRIALENAAEIRAIYKKVSGSERPEDWHPLHVICEACGKVGTTKVTHFDGENVNYSCEPKMVEWAQGCGHSGAISPFNGNAKLPWKVEWAAKFVVQGVHIEGGGKDHSTRGGARDVANHIARDIYNYEPPLDIPYEFFLINGQKMSSSKGLGASAYEISELVPPEILRLALIGKEPRRQYNFIPDGDTIPTLYDQADTLLTDKKGESGESRMYHFALPPEKRRMDPHFRPRFSQVVFMIQMPHIDVFRESEKIKGNALSPLEHQSLVERTHYAQIWLERVAPEDFKFELQKSLPECAQNLTDSQRKVLGQVLEYIETIDSLDGQELHTKLHDLRKESGLEPKEFFSAIYCCILGKESGPKMGWFLSVLEREFLTSRLREVRN